MASHRAAPHHTASHRITPHGTAPHSIAPHHTAPHRTAPHHPASHRISPHRIESLRARNPKARLALVGKGPDSDALKEHFKGTKTVLTGVMTGEALSQAFASADVFVMPSDTETLGFVVLESMASGVPVVGANAGGIPDLIDDGKVCFVCVEVSRFFGGGCLFCCATAAPFPGYFSCFERRALRGILSWTAAPFSGYFSCFERRALRGILSWTVGFSSGYFWCFRGGRAFGALSRVGGFVGKMGG